MPSIEQQIKEGFDKLATDFETFKKDNDKRIERIEKSGANPGDREEKLAKIEQALDAKTAEIEKLQAALNRINQGGDETEGKSKEKATAEKKAFEKAMRRGEASLTPDEQKALSVASDPDGGYLVRNEVSAEITKKIFESSPVRQFADVVTISTNALEEPADFDEVSSSWVGERSSRATTDTPELQNLRIPTHELYAKPKATQQILEDAAVDIEALSIERFD